MAGPMVTLSSGLIYQADHLTADSSLDLSPSAPAHTQVAMTTMQSVTQAVKAPAPSAGPAPPFNPFPPVGTEGGFVRNYQVATATWSPTDAIGTNLLTAVFPEALKAKPAIDRLLQYFTHFRADVRVRVEIIAPPTTAGMILVTPMPFYDYNTGIQHLNIFQLVQWPGAGILSASKGANYETVIPWSAYSPYMRVEDIGTNCLCGIGCLAVTVLAPLNQPGATSPADVTVNVYATFENVSVTGFIPFPPTPLGSISLGTERGATIYTAQSKVEGAVRSAKGVMSAIATASAPAHGSLEPLTALLPTAVSDVIDTVASIATPFLDQPASQQAPQPTIVSSSTLHYAHGLSPCQTSSYTPGVTAPEIGSWFAARDINPSFSEIAMRPGLVRYGVGPDTGTGSIPGILSTATPDSLVTNFTTHVSPFAQMYFDTVGEQWTVPLPCGAIAAGFSGWRGTMKYLIKFSAQGMATARVRLVYIPSVVTPPSSIENYAGEVISKLIDISGDTDVEFEVPAFINGTYLPVPRGPSMMPLSNEISSTATGQIALYVVTPPTTYDSTSTFISWFLFQAASSDFQVYKPRSSFTQVYVTNPPAAPATRLKSVVDSKTPSTHRPQASQDLSSTFKTKFPPLMDTTPWLDKKFVNTDPVTCLAEIQRRGEQSQEGFTDSSYNFGWLITPYHEPVTSPIFDNNFSWARYLAGCHRGHRGAQRLQVYDGIPDASFTCRTTGGISLTTDNMFSGSPILAVEMPYLSNLFYAPCLAQGVPQLTASYDDLGLTMDWQITGANAMTHSWFFSSADDTVYYDWRPCLIVGVPSTSKPSVEVSVQKPVAPKLRKQ